ncbi:unnamed protein product, partial [Didymodactylos carnosus]
MGCGSSIHLSAKQKLLTSSLPKPTTNGTVTKLGRLPPITNESSTLRSTVITKNKLTKNAPYDCSQNLESFSVVWLDRSIKKFNDLDDIQKELRAIIHYIRLFDLPEECEDYVKKLKEDNIYFIVTSECSPNIISHIHDLQQIQAIYIFVKQKRNDKEQRTKHYSK